MDPRRRVRGAPVPNVIRDLFFAFFGLISIIQALFGLEWAFVFAVVGFALASLAWAVERRRTR